jgi:hypothetical protein
MTGCLDFITPKAPGFRSGAGWWGPAGPLPLLVFLAHQLQGFGFYLVGVFPRLFRDVPELV